jgi:hypothetical protein
MMATNDAVLEQHDCHWVCALGWCSEVSLFLEQLAWSAWFGSARREPAGRFDLGGVRGFKPRQGLRRKEISALSCPVA